MAAASIIASVITGGSNLHQTVAEELNAYATDFVNQGVVGAITLGAGSTAGTGAFAVTQDASPDMGVTVLTGNAYVSGTPSGQDAQVIRARMTSNYTGYTINANSSGSTKYDWIYLQLSATNANNPSSAADNVITLVTSRSTSNASDNGTPPTYGILLAVVTVVNGASSITNSNISDRRTQASLSSVNSGSTTGWTSLGYALTYGANNGNKEFTVTIPNNLSTLLSTGMRLSIARSVTPPTQCMAFTSASSQYATKASPTGITFTGPFTCEAWIYLNSYTGQNQGIIGRTDGSTGGFFLSINSSGQVVVGYAASSAFTQWNSYQSVPLGRWVHVAAVVSSVASKTLQGIYINGISVPTTNTASAATTLTQTSNLSVGAYGAGVANTFFNGYISEARVWPVAQTAANIQANMAINCVGNETNLIALYQGNGAFTDATSNANNLTATNGAVATQASNPYNATEYFIITKVSYSNPTTTLTLLGGTDCTLPNQTLNSPYYSTAREPYGFPANRSKWVADMYFYAGSAATPGAGAIINISSLKLTVPTGEWLLGGEGVLYFGVSGNSTGVGQIGLNTSNNAMPADVRFQKSFYAQNSATGQEMFYSFSIRTPLLLASATDYFLVGKTANATTHFDLRAEAPTLIQAESAYV